MRRGRLPGATEDGCDGLAQDCDPRDDGTSPVPGITGAWREVSLGVAENALPILSMAQQ